MIGHGRADEIWAWSTGSYDGPIKGYVWGPVNWQKQRRLAIFGSAAKALDAIFFLSSDLSYELQETKVPKGRGWDTHPVTGRFIRRR